MATTYSDTKSFPKFGSFVRAVVGLPFTPLERLEEAMAVLEKIAMANTGARRKFCKFMIKYLRATWLDGSIPREVWNMYQHEGVTTNNHAEVIIRSKFNRITIFTFRLSTSKWARRRKSPNIQIHMS